jgi:hypothetical protein
LLINQSTLTVNPSTKVPYELDSNPRTAIGQIRDDQYIGIAKNYIKDACVKAMQIVNEIVDLF